MFSFLPRFSIVSVRDMCALDRAALPTAIKSLLAMLLTRTCELVALLRACPSSSRYKCRSLTSESRACHCSIQFLRAVSTGKQAKKTKKNNTVKRHPVTGEVISSVADMEEAVATKGPVICDHAKCGCCEQRCTGYLVVAHKRASHSACNSSARARYLLKRSTRESATAAAVLEQQQPS